MTFRLACVLSLYFGSAFFDSTSIVAQTTPPSNRIEVDGQSLWISGTNVAWVDFAGDLGPNPLRTSDFDRMFKELRANGGNTVRFWMHTTGGRTPQWNGSMVTGPGSRTIQNLTELLDMAESYDITVLLSLWSFDMLRIANGTTNTDRAYAILTQDANRQSYITNSLIPMVDAVKGHKAILAWEIFNEAEGMSNEFGWDFNRHVSMLNIQKFVNQTAGAIKRTDPTAKVTTGIVSATAMSDIYTASNPVQMNYYRDDRLRLSGGDQDGILDFYTLHYYGYGDSPFSRQASYFQLDKPVFIGEFFIKGTADGVAADVQYKRLYDNGYAGALSWQWVDWDQNRDNNTATWPNTLLNTQHMYANHRDDVELTFSDKAGTYAIQVRDTVIEAGFGSVIKWQTRDVDLVRLNDANVLPMGSLDVNPQTTTTYRFEFIDGEVMVVDSIRIRVIPNNLVDRATANPLVRSENGREIESDFGKSYDIQYLQFKFGSDITSPIDIQTSYDGNTWTTQRTLEISPIFMGFREEFFETPIPTRYIRLLSDSVIPLDGMSAFGLLSSIQPPRLRIITPVDGGIFENETRTTITAEAIRGTGNLSGAALQINGQTVRTYRFPPYTYTWDLTQAGEYDIQLILTDSHFGSMKSRPIRITVSPTVQKTRYEAEQASLGNGLTVVQNASASNGSYVLMESAGNITWNNVSAATAQEYTIRIGYHTPFGVKTQYLRVNGAQEQTIEFLSPGSSFDYLERTVSLNAGVNQISIINFWGYMWFDYIELRGNGLITDIERTPETATEFRLEQNYPNPFNPSTQIQFTLRTSNLARLSVYDILGREVAVLVDGVLPAGTHHVTFDATGLASGIYVYRLTSGDQSITRRMLLIR